MRERKDLGRGCMGDERREILETEDKARPRVQKASKREIIESGRTLVTIPE